MAPNSRSSQQPPAHDPDLIHVSTRSCVATNAGIAPGEPARITLRTSRLEIRWLDGDVAMRFAAQEVDVTPRPRTLPRGDKR